MIDMLVRDEDLVDASYLPRRQRKNFSDIEQQAALSNSVSTYTVGSP
jgi:hypothetical protein